jgi:hypothetical protein|tara:strand:- start:286 stop:507 length:222 start_codon:yes stop_codon:yes gene_type:complete
MKKYLCVGTDKVPAEWLPRWYEVPFDECIMYESEWNVFKPEQYTDLLTLTVIPNGCYKKHLKTLKTERLLNGI